MGESDGQKVTPLVNIEQTLPSECWGRACYLYKRTRRGNMHRGRYFDFFHFYIAGVADMLAVNPALLADYVKETVDEKAPYVPDLDDVELLRFPYPQGDRGSIEVRELREKLRNLASEYGQDAIGLSVGESELVEAF